MTGPIKPSEVAAAKIACDDRLVELGEMRELTGPETWGQHRVFVRAKADAG